MKEITVVRINTNRWKSLGNKQYEQIKEVYTAFVDDDMFEVLSKYTWHIHVSTSGSIYFRSQIPGTRIRFFMHSFIIGCAIKPYVIDHIDGNICNILKNNLELVTHRQNTQNRHVSTLHSLPGVYYIVNNILRPWSAQITVNYRHRSLGHFSNKVEAFFAYKKSVEDLGECFTPWVLEKCYKIIDTEMVHI